jgi:hypothetical protein
VIYLFLLGGLFLLASRGKSVQGSSTPPQGISPYEDLEIRKVVAYALAHETDLAVLSNLARLVNAAGYTELAKTIYDRQNALAPARQ